MAEAPLPNLGSLVSQAELLRTRALQLMQADPEAAVDPADRQAYADLVAAAHAAGGLSGDERILGLDDAGDLASVARLHRSTGLLEHELLVRLARLRAQRRPTPEP